MCLQNNQPRSKNNKDLQHITCQRSGYLSQQAGGQVFDRGCWPRPAGNPANYSPFHNIIYQDAGQVNTLKPLPWGGGLRPPPRLCCFHPPAADFYSFCCVCCKGICANLLTCFFGNRITADDNFNIFAHPGFLQTVNSNFHRLQGKR